MLDGELAGDSHVARVDVGPEVAQAILRMAETGDDAGVVLRAEDVAQAKGDDLHTGVQVTMMRFVGIIIRVLKAKKFQLPNCEIDGRMTQAERLSMKKVVMIIFSASMINLSVNTS